MQSVPDSKLSSFALMGLVDSMPTGFFHKLTGTAFYDPKHPSSNADPSTAKTGVPKGTGGGSNKVQWHSSEEIGFNSQVYLLFDGKGLQTFNFGYFTVFKVVGFLN
jgi:hypothetical protein